MRIDYTNPTDNEIRRIVAEALDPSSQVEILSQTSGKTVNEIRRICGMKPKRAGSVYKSRKRRPWSEEDVEWLKANSEVPLKEQALHLKRHIDVIVYKRKQLGLKMPTPWTEDKIAKLKKLYAEGLRAKGISLELGLDRQTVANKITVLKQAKKI